MSGRGKLVGGLGLMIASQTQESLQHKNSADGSYDLGAVHKSLSVLKKSAGPHQFDNEWGKQTCDSKCLQQSGDEK